jgi:hypothetical protein
VTADEYRFQLQLILAGYRETSASTVREARGQVAVLARMQRQLRDLKRQLNQDKKLIRERVFVTEDGIGAVETGDRLASIPGREGASPVSALDRALARFAQRQRLAPLETVGLEIDHARLRIEGIALGLRQWIAHQGPSAPRRQAQP